MFIHPYLGNKKYKHAINVAVNFIYYLRLSDLLYYVQSKILRKKIRVIIYHSIPLERKNEFESHLGFYKKNYTIIDEAELIRFFDNNEIKLDKQGLILSFDDGYKNNYDIVKPVLEKHNITGWFFIPTGILKIDKEQHLEFAKINRLSYELNEDERIFMNKFELMELSENHVIGCHTDRHVRLSDEVSKNNEILESEIIKSKIYLEEILVKKVRSFAWVGGEENNYSSLANKIIKSNYEYSFLSRAGLISKKSAPYFINRIHVPIEFNLKQLKFQLSGIIDLFYWLSRCRLRKKLGINNF
jgi:peptidoglycan/xylan/chitin deacetylase (PgdA/CDA1 family)